MFQSGCIFTVTTLDGFIGNAITLQPAPTATFRNYFNFECLNCDDAERTEEKYELM